MVSDVDDDADSTWFQMLMNALSGDVIPYCEKRVILRWLLAEGLPEA